MNCNFLLWRLERPVDEDLPLWIVLIATTVGTVSSAFDVRNAVLRSFPTIVRVILRSRPLFSTVLLLSP